jgi:hypothetical protein
MNPFALPFRHSARQTPTGITGFDQITGGGLPRVGILSRTPLLQALGSGRGIVSE